MRKTRLKSNNNEANQGTLSQTSDLSIDPLLINALTQYSSSQGVASNLIASSNGIRTWRNCLGKGRFPNDADFDQGVWPAEPFFSKVIDAMTTLQLSRFVKRHPDTLSAVLLTLIRLTFKFMGDIQIMQEKKEIYEVSEDTDDLYETEIGLDQRSEEILNVDLSLSSEELDELASSVVESLIQEWGGVVSSVNILDQLFGYDHDMLNVNPHNNADGNTMAGFGLEDGIWKHTGWQKIDPLQKQIASMQELKELMKNIGRRPTAENSNKLQKFAPRKLQNDGSIGAEFDEQMRESVSGITFSGSLTDMLPSEAVLLRGPSRTLRRLFMAKRVEKKLLSYEISGWTDVPSISKTRPRYSRRMPSAPGGPIIVCLDTSWSMSGMREQLSKAVVLACVTIAHKQKRDCQIVAFSTEQGVIEAGVVTPDNEGINRLLDFLSHSFGGGTDVTGALKYAMETLDSDMMSAADILLVSDGEIPDPPVSIEIMERLDLLKTRKNVKIHGLLVGKRESKPLSRLCTNVHDFLANYDMELSWVDSRSSTTTALRDTAQKLLKDSKHRITYGFTNSRTRRKRPFPLYAKYYDDYNGATTGKRSKRRNKKNRNQWEDGDDGYYSESTLIQNEEEDPELNEKETNLFTSDLEKSIKALKNSASKSLAAECWKPELLLTEKEVEGSCWKHTGELEGAITTVSAGLIERQDEARLVVLSMISMEHILLLGVPGTGKSILGKRLSKLLSNSEFFQLLLTKFTTPEELFGPLSLKSLEEDEYRRCTAGFLPTASIAFLDEIFKSNSAILNTLLTILNERKFDNARVQENCPIKCVVGASNELPESDELVALFDRFLIRKEVLPVSDNGVIELLSMSNAGCDINTDESCDVNFTGDLDEIIEDISLAIDNVNISVDICELVRDLRLFLREEHNVEISDRRLVKAGRLLRISAASQGRSRVDLIDCLLLQHCFWNVPEQRIIIQDWLWDNITPGNELKQLRLLLDTVRNEITEIVRKTTGDITGKSGARKDQIDIINGLRVETTRILIMLQKCQSNILRHMELLRHAEKFLWINPDEMTSSKQLLLPRAEQVLVELDKALIDCRSLQFCLDCANEVVSNESRLEIIKNLWEEGYKPEINFTDEEMEMGMKEAKKKFDLETFRKWKRIRKRTEKNGKKR